MRSSRKLLLLVLCVLYSVSTSAQVSDVMSTTPWKAQWIAVPNEAPTAYGVYFFRKTITLTAKPTVFKVRVSADNRYKLYVNGRLVSLGPARGDLYYWKYETVDLAPFLTAGTNTVAAVVWNESDYRPEAQISLRTGFILQSDSPIADELNTNSSWKCVRDSSRQPLTGGVGYPTYYVAGPGEIVNYYKSIKGWMDAPFDDSAWYQAIRIDQGNPKGVPNASGWMLVPSALPQMERTVQRMVLLRKATGVDVPAGFPAVKTMVTIPAHTTATLLLDQTFLTDAFFSLNFSKGKNAGIAISYAEALFSYSNGHRYKANRDDVEGKTFLGRKDSLIADGSVNQTFTTMAWRTYRYVQISVTTAGEQLAINDVYGTFTGYPFRQTAKLNTGNPEIRHMLDIGWRTARLCANETYMDCPYYEQLQYIGDSRIQALISYYNSGDDRLARNALDQMDHSRLAEGITLSRHPSFSPQVISTFSLWYIAMLHDYRMYRNDDNFVKNKLEGTRAILHFFEQYQQSNGSLKHTPYWTFTDWIDSKGWDFGMAPKSSNGNSAAVDLQLLMAYQLAAEMEAQLGMLAFAVKYNATAMKMKATIQHKYWNAKRALYSDTEEQELYSQHTNSLAVFARMVNGIAANALCKHIAADTSLTQATIYFKYYVYQALIKGGMGDDYLKWLDQWRKDMKAGLTTWAEISDIENVRSDCHAWGASPNIEFYRTLLGIDSEAPGFRKIKVEPHLGSLKDVSGEIPHPGGRVSASYKLLQGRWHISIALPQKTSGRLFWKNKSYLLKAGENNMVI